MQFGKVHKGLWRSTVVAIKIMMVGSAASHSEGRGSVSDNCAVASSVWMSHVATPCTNQEQAAIFAVMKCKGKHSAHEQWNTAYSDLHPMFPSQSKQRCAAHSDAQCAVKRKSAHLSKQRCAAHSGAHECAVKRKSAQ
eukprot:1161863-Pelagomonas_calceolata.AAC.5